jgi:hypothetical protein
MTHQMPLIGGLAACLVLASACSSVSATPARTTAELVAAVQPASAAPATSPSPKSRALTFDIAFATHIDENLPEQDVYLERVPGTGLVYRATKGDNDMNAPLYGSALENHHDPFNPKAVGPYAKGKALGVTLGEWLKARGTGKYSYANGVGHLDLEFTGLVPNGVYTLWHAFIALPPTTPFSGTLDLPLGARDGTESVFRADAEGNARFVHTFRPGLQMSDVWTKSMLAVAYHSDGSTYGGVPGEFGVSVHIPLFAMLPDREGLE